MQVDKEDPVGVGVHVRLQSDGPPPAGPKLSPRASVTKSVRTRRPRRTANSQVACS